MKKHLIYIGILTVLVLSVYGFYRAEKAVFWKGNMHAHSFWSDGNTFPEEVAHWYKSQGYHFLAVTDHNILQEGEKWYNVDRNQTIRHTYDAYLEHYGGMGLETKIVENQLHARLLGLVEYRERFEVPNEFLLISSEEISDAAERKPVHLNGIDLPGLVSPAKGDKVGTCLKNNVEKINETLKKVDRVDWVIVNHPNFGWALTIDDLAQSGARFFEVYNGHPSVRNYGDADHPSAETMWDEANLIRIQEDKPLLFGVANDDAHDYLTFGVGRANPGRGWNMVRASTLTTDALYSSMIAGDFYLSTGVDVADFTVSKRGIRLRINGETDISYRIEFIGMMAGDRKVSILKSVDGIRGQYRFDGDELFVRARIISSKEQDNPYQEGDVEMAWLQPVRPNQ